MEGTSKSKKKEQTSERESEATSKKTLREVQQSEKSSESENHDTGVPSPNGSFTEDEELKDSGPM